MLNKILVENNIYKLWNSLVVRNGIYGIIDFFVSLFLMIVVTPILIYRLGIEQFGLWSICNAILGLTGRLFDFGLGATIIKYVAEYWSKKELENVAGIISTVLVLNFVMAVFIVLPIFIFSPVLSRLLPSTVGTPEDLAQIFRITTVGFIPMLLKNIFISIPKGFQDYKTPAILSISNNILSMALMIIIVVTGGSVREVIIGSVVFLWIYTLICFGAAVRKMMENKIRFVFSVKGIHIRKALSFSIFIALTVIGQAIFGILDRITVGIVLGLSAAGYYTIAVGIASKLPAIGSVITQPLMPAFSVWSIQHDQKELQRRLWYATLMISAISIMVAVLLIIIARPMLFLWLGETTALQVLPVFRILVAVYVITPCTAPAYQAVIGLGHPWIAALSVWLMAVSTILLIFIFGREFGLLGAAMANGAILFLLIMPIFAFFKMNKIYTNKVVDK